MKIRFLGHAAFLIEGSVTLLLDPFLTGNPAAAMSASEVNTDYILVSHGHGDHFGDTLAIAERTKAPIITVNELALYCQEKGCASHAMHIGGFHRFGDTFGVKLTTALHGAAEDGVYKGIACGFLIYLDGKTLYFAGDTGLTYDMKAVIGDLNAIDVAMLPIGDNFTMGVEDAAVAAQWLKAKTVIPMHYNTFPIIEQDPLVFKKKAEENGADVVILKSGQVHTL